MLENMKKDMYVKIVVRYLDKMVRKKKGFANKKCIVCGYVKYMQTRRVTCGKVCARKLRNSASGYYPRKKK